MRQAAHVALQCNRGRRPASPPGNSRVGARRLAGDLLARSAGVARTPVRRGAGGRQPRVSGVCQHASARLVGIGRSEIGSCRICRGHPALSRPFRWIRGSLRCVPDLHRARTPRSRRSRVDPRQGRRRLGTGLGDPGSAMKCLEADGSGYLKHRKVFP
jgi:hypothetical protein